MFIDADDKLIVKRMLIMLGLILVPVGIMFLAVWAGLNDYAIYEKIIGALLIIAGIAIVTVMIRHIKQTVVLQIILTSSRTHEYAKITA